MVFPSISRRTCFSGVDYEGMIDVSNEKIVQEESRE